MPTLMQLPKYRHVNPFRCALAVLVALGCEGWATTVGAQAAERGDAAAGRIQRDIIYLASDRLEGRLTGTPGNDSAAAYLARAVASLGLRTLAVDTARRACREVPVPSDCGSFLQRFVARTAEMVRRGQPEGVPTQNVVSLLRGSDTLLRNEYVVVGAHFDHLGRSTVSALDPEARDAIRRGADDNASGTAAVLELARRFAAVPTRRSIIFANFSAEELGLLGSQWFVEHAPVSLDRIVAMVNFDMVGRLRNDRVIVYGVATATELPAILDSANLGPHLTMSAIGDGFGPSDHSSFHAKGIPVLHFYTDSHADYHKASDQADRVNSVGEARVVALAERAVRAIADRPARLTAVQGPAPAPPASSRERIAAYLGSIPDMSAGEISGLRLSGVRPGSPADSGGLRAGDVIVEFGGAAVNDLYAYTDAMRAHKPGDVIRIVFQRGSERLVTMVTLGARGT